MGVKPKERQKIKILGQGSYDPVFYHEESSDEDREPERTWLTEDEAWQIVDLVNFDLGED